MEHPAKKLGKWLRERRRESGIVLREFAGQIALAPSEYAEVEAGVSRWIEDEQEELIIEVLRLSNDDKSSFHEMLTEAMGANPLEFSDVFTREQLRPIRTRTEEGQQLTDETRESLLDAVFKPLS